MAQDDFTRGLKTERMTNIALAFKKTGAMLAAIDLELFTHISNGKATADEIGAVLGIDAEKIDRLLTACKSMDMIREIDGRHENFSDAQRYLVKGTRTYFGDYLAYIARRDYSAWEFITDHLTAKPDNNDDDERTYLSLMQDPEEARKFTIAGYEASIGLGHKLAKQFDFSRHKRWLDLGGGSGCYAIPACERHDGIAVTIMDQINVIAVARDYIGKHGLTGRIDTVPGNFFETPFPTGYDLASFITPLQGYMPDRIIEVLTKTRKALAPGGTMLIVDYMLHDDKTGPLDPAFVNLFGIRQGRYLGRVNTGAEWCGFLAEAGFSNARASWFTLHQLGLITARKPD